MTHSISNVVFEGGGVRGIAHRGALEALAKAALLHAAIFKNGIT